MRVFDLKYSDNFKQKFSEESIKILEEGFLTNHKYCKQFEDSFASKIGAKYSTCVSNGTAALEVSIQSLGLQNTKIITTTNTFIATATAITNTRNKLVLTDIEKKFFSMCPISLENMIRKHGPKNIGAIIVVHIGGHIADSFSQIIDIATKYSIPIIEDSAQAQFSTLNGKFAGTIGDLGTFSFFTTKVMTTGEGGMVTTNSLELFNRNQSHRQFGKSDTDSTIHLNTGSNYKLNEFSALLGCLELERIDERINKRRQIAKIYQEHLDKNKYYTVSDTDSSKGSYYKQIVYSKDIHRTKIQSELKKNNYTLTGGVYYTPVHLQPVYAKLFNPQDFPVANDFAEKHFCPPCYPELELEDIVDLCKILNNL